MHRMLTLFTLCFLLLGCKENVPPVDKELLTLKDWMTGSFSSQLQAEQDTNYFDIRLEMAEIWPENESAEWLYVEQAASWALDRPYRQRVYRLSRLEDGSIESAVFSLDSPLRFAGAWRSETPLEALSPDSLLQREGCALLLHQEGDRFVGSTREKLCGSTLRGASYATSEVEIKADVLTSWDRGFDSTDVQVWGAELGPYIFRKLTK